MKREGLRNGAIAAIWPQATSNKQQTIDFTKIGRRGL